MIGACSIQTDNRVLVGLFIGYEEFRIPNRRSTRVANVLRTLLLKSQQTHAPGSTRRLYTDPIIMHILLRNIDVSDGRHDEGVIDREGVGPAPLQDERRSRGHSKLLRLCAHNDPCCLLSWKEAEGYAPKSGVYGCCNGAC